MNVCYLTLDVLLAIHDSMIELYGGSHGIRDLTLIQSALARPQSTFGGEELYPTLLDKAAALFHSLLFNHGFVDGNKRTAFTATARFLFINGFELSAKDEELIQFPVTVENEHFDIGQIASWLEGYTEYNG